MVEGRRGSSAFFQQDITVGIGEAEPYGLEVESLECNQDIGGFQLAACGWLAVQAGQGVAGFGDSAQGIAVEGAGACKSVKPESVSPFSDKGLPYICATGLQKQESSARLRISLWGC